MLNLNKITDFVDTHPVGRVFNLGAKKAVWKKVTELATGVKIAVEKDGALDWDEIVEIKSIGRERVYDIEVEGTHNFVANSILAHNTLITGNVGIGTTSPLAPLQIGAGTNTHTMSTGDAFITSDLELDGNLYLDGGTLANFAGTASIILSSAPTTVANTLSASNWLIENTANLGQAALMVNNTKAGDLFTASASGTPKFTIFNDGAIRLASDISSTSNTLEGTIFYDNNSAGSASTDHLFLRGSDSAWHRLALDMTKYSANNASVANSSYVEIAHNQGTNDLSLTGWVYDTISSLWKNISEYSHTIKHALQNEFNDASGKNFDVDTSGTLLNNLIAFWTLNETSSTLTTAVSRYDSYGSNTLTDNPATTYTLSGTGKRDNAADFESGNSNFLEITDNGPLSTGDIDFTVTSLVNLESTGANRMIATKSESASVAEYELYYNNTSSRFEFVTYNSSGTAVCTATANNLGAPSTAIWYFITAWHDATANTCNIQVNNGTADSAAESGVPSDTAANFRVGARYTTEALFFDGLIDEVGFWKKTLSTQEKTDLYNSGNGNSYTTHGNVVRTQTALTSISLQPAVDVGTGADGAITIAANTDINVTNSIVGRSCSDGGDAVNYSVTTSTSTTATLSTTPSTGCLTAGDEVLLINLQGTTSSQVNLGNYETLKISSVSTNVVTFKTAKTKYYGDNATDDTNIGTAAGTQKVMLQRVPNYTNVFVDASINFTPTAWNGTKGGVMFFRASESVTVSGNIHANALGYRGGTTVQVAGEAFCGNPGGGNGGNTGQNGSNGNCGGGGGGGADSSPSRGTGGSGSSSLGGGGGGAGSIGNASTSYAGGGGAGGHITAGTKGTGVNSGVDGGTGTSGAGGTADATTRSGGGGGGGTYDSTTDFTKLMFGSGGGSGGNYLACFGAGGDGGGIVSIYANTFSVSGTVGTNGENGSNSGATCGPGGGGAAGSVMLNAQTLVLGTNLVSATGGSGGTGSGMGYVGGTAGNGKTGIYYTTSYSGSASSPSPTYTLSGYNTYGLYHSPVINTPNAATYESLRWETPVVPYGKVEFQTRSGATLSPTDGTWETWKPFTATTNYLTLQSADTHTDWTGTNATVAEGDVARNVDQFEDEDEATAGNLTKITSSTSGGYAEATISSTDISTYDYITAWVRSSQTGSTVKIGFGESAATEQEETVNVDTAGTWQKVYWDLSDIQSAQRDAVTKLRFTNLIAAANTIYIDNVRAERLLTNGSHAVVSSTPNNYFQYRIIFSTTNTSYQPQVENIYLVYNDGFKLVQTDTNTVRLYNNSGLTQNLRLDATVFGADLAEWYTVDDQSINPGDLVATTGQLDENGVPILRKTNQVNDPMAVGVISTKAGQALGVEREDRRLLTLAGRIPVKIDSNSPTIKAGDYITSSSLAGYGRRAKWTNIAIGKAFENWDSSSGKTTVLILVNNQPARAYQVAAEDILNIVNDSVNGGWTIVSEQTGEAIDAIGAFADLIAANVRAGAITTRQLATDSLTAFTATIDNLLINNGLVSPVVQTNFISPLADETDVVIKLGKQNTSGESKPTPEVGSAEESYGKLAIQNAQGEEVASIDSSGSAEFKSASISGELYAEKITSPELDRIEELLKQVKEDQDLLAQAKTWTTDTATESTTENLYVTGQAAISSLSISNSLSIGTDFVINSTSGEPGLTPEVSLNTLSAPLKLQSLAMAPVEIMAGKFRIETNGNVAINADLIVSGKIEAESLRAKEITTERLVIAMEATSSASLEASSSGIIKTNATAGTATITAELSELTIENSKIETSSLVYVTPTSTTNNNVLYVKSKEAGKFVVGFNQALDIDVTFNWWIIEIK